MVFRDCEIRSWESAFGDSKSHLHLRVICLANHASVQGFVVDFYCHKSALVVEVDGDIHDLQQEEMPGGRRRCPRWGWGLSGLGMMRS